jgi:hypothetical protein
MKAELNKRKKLINKKYPIEEVAEILGYYDGSNPDIDEEITADEGTLEWIEQVLNMAATNGNFEHLWIKEDKK